MKRIRFTDAELSAIISMAAIAGAGSPEGDYQDWTDETYHAAATAAAKAGKIQRARAEVKLLKEEEKS